MLCYFCVTAKRASNLKPQMHFIMQHKGSEKQAGVNKTTYT